MTKTRKPLCIGSPVFSDLVRDCGRVLAQELCYFTGLPLIQGLFDKNAVIQGKMFMVSWYQFRHSGLLFPPPVGRQHDHYMTSYECVKG